MGGNAGPETDSSGSAHSGPHAAGSYGSSYDTSSYGTVPHSTPPHPTPPHPTPPHATPPHPTAPPTALHPTALHPTAPHATALHATPPHATAPHATAPHPAAPHATAPPATAPHPAAPHATAPHPTALHLTAPHATAPQAPVPQAPVPQAPVPQAPVPQAPVPQATGSDNTTSYGAGSYPDAYGAAVGSQAARDAGWGPPDASNGRPAEGSWQHSGQVGIGGPGSAAPMNGYTTLLPNGYAGALPASPADTPAGGIPYAQGGNSTNGYASPPSAGGFAASGYLSSSALSARHSRLQPEPLTSPSSANPYGSYVTGPPRAADNSAKGPEPRRQARHRSASAYDDQGSYGGYGDDGGGSRH